MRADAAAAKKAAQQQQQQPNAAVAMPNKKLKRIKMEAGVGEMEEEEEDAAADEHAQQQQQQQQQQQVVELKAEIRIKDAVSQQRFKPRIPSCKQPYNSMLARPGAMLLSNSRPSWPLPMLRLRLWCLLRQLPIQAGALNTVEANRYFDGRKCHAQSYSEHFFFWVLTAVSRSTRQRGRLQKQLV